MFNLRYIVRLISTFFSKFKAIILLATFSGILIFLLIALIAPTLATNRIERIGLTGRFTTSTLPVEILELAGDGLTKVNASGDVEPNLATSWETPDKGKTWTFKLKEGISWQDDSSVTSETINYQFSDLTTEKPNENTLIYKLETPYSAFPSVVSRPIFKKGLLGTGESKVKNISLSGGFVSSLTLLDQEKNKKVYKFYPTEERTKLAFRLGEVDIIQDIINPDPLTSWKNVKVLKVSDRGNYVAIFFNTQDSLLSDKNVRQALSYGINKDQFEQERALGPISMNSWAFNPQVKPYTFDPVKAKDSIKEIENMTINLTTSPILLSVAEKIAKDWKEIGVTTNIQVSSTIPEGSQALLAIFDIPEDPDQYTFWHSTQTATNITKFSNPRIDKLLEDGRAELNLEERKKIYLDFQRFLVEDSPAIFLYYPTTTTISRN